MALQYLKALNLLFERGILSCAHVTSAESVVLQYIQQGLKYFRDWKDDVIGYG